MLSPGAEAWGFRGELWTARRVATIVRWQFGIKYQSRQGRRLLKQLQWTPQKPIQRALQRDEEAIQRWREQVWPALKKGARARSTDRFRRRSRVLPAAWGSADLRAQRRAAHP